MKHCKHCGNPIKPTLTGLKDFCSADCKKAYRLAYQADWIKKKRGVDKKGGYGNMDSQNVDSANSHEKPICEAKKGGLGLGEGNFTLKMGETIAKKYCPEFKRKIREGYCIRDSMPHEIQCSACITGKLRDIKGNNLDFKHLFKKNV